MDGMAKFISNRLARLIKARAYTAGSLPVLDRKIDELEQSLRKLREDAVAARERVQLLDAEIARTASSIEPSDIRSIRPTPRRPGTRYGRVTDAVIALLQEVQEDGITIEEIVMRLNNPDALPWVTADDRDRTRHKIRNILTKLTLKGVLVGVEIPGSSHFMKRWFWIGPTPTKR
jgi:hypothetical protein